jgi:hypothetical protein
MVNMIIQSALCYDLTESKQKERLAKLIREDSEVDRVVFIGKYYESLYSGLLKAITAGQTKVLSLTFIADKTEVAHPTCNLWRLLTQLLTSKTRVALLDLSGYQNNNMAVCLSEFPSTYYHGGPNPFLYVKFKRADRYITSQSIRKVFDCLIKVLAHFSPASVKKSGHKLPTEHIKLVKWFLINQ